MKHRAYIDIETTGLSRNGSDLTVIGIGLEAGQKIEIMQLIENDLYKQKLLNALKGVDEIYSYNGRRFDLPFIKAKLGIDLTGLVRHTDLMYDCWKKDLKGGLKVVERILKIDREIQGVDGFMAVQLWWKYVNSNDKRALQTLLDYNKEDVVNLKVLRERLGVL
jgi:uncharacterized protein